MTTYRDLLTPLFGADALREAEARVYDRPASAFSSGRYQCADGYCALGIMLRYIPHYPGATRFPDPRRVGHSLSLSITAEEAVRQIAFANDRGEFQRAGALTAFLDRDLASDTEPQP